jgi:TIR domain
MSIGTTSSLRAFLSHASEDKASFVESLARYLAEMGVDPWLDKWEIRPGDSLVQKLFDEGIETVSAVIVVVSPFSAGKPWVREELDAAVVRRITGKIRLIPVRPDDAVMPAPLQHLLWIPAERTADGARTAAAKIADILYGRELRPAVAPPPDYTARPRLPGLTPADSALLVMLIAEALEAGSRVVIWPRVKAKAEESQLTSDALEEAFTALEQRRYLKVTGIAGGPHTVEISAGAFRPGVDHVVPDAEAARRKIIAPLVNDPPASDRPVEELAASTGKPFLFVFEFLRQLERQGYVHLAGMFRIIPGPTLKRLLDAS